MITTKYVLVVESAAVTTVVMVFVPIDRLIALLARPEVTGFPFTVIDAPAFEAVGVTVTLDTLFATLAV